MSLPVVINLGGYTYGDITSAATIPVTDINGNVVDLSNANTILLACRQVGGDDSFTIEGTGTSAGVATFEGLAASGVAPDNGKIFQYTARLSWIAGGDLGPTYHRADIRFWVERFTASAGGGASFSAPSWLTQFRAVQVVRPPQDYKDGRYAANQLSGFQEMSGAGASLKGIAGVHECIAGPGAHQLAEWDSNTAGSPTTKGHNAAGKPPECALPWYVRGTLYETFPISPAGRQIAFIGMGSIHRNNFDSDPSGALGYATTAVHLRFNFTANHWELAVFDSLSDWDVLAFTAETNSERTAEILYTPGESIQCWLDGVAQTTYADATHLQNLSDAGGNGLTTFSGLCFGVCSGSDAAGKLTAKWCWPEAVHWRDF